MGTTSLKEAWKLPLGWHKGVALQDLKSSQSGVEAEQLAAGPPSYQEQQVKGQQALANLYCLWPEHVARVWCDEFVCGAGYHFAAQS